MEVFEIGLNDLEPINLNLTDDTISSKPSVNFGSGIELLMNDKNISSSKVHMDLGDLDNLETELNDLSKSIDYSTTNQSNESTSNSYSGFTSNLFGLGGFGNNTSSTTDSGLGQATVDSIGNTKTWDGFSKINEIPMSNDTTIGGGIGGMANEAAAALPKMNEKERRRKKRAMLKKLDEWYDKGTIKHNSHFTMDSPYDEVEDEYETAMDDKRKKDSIKLQGWWFMTLINSLEYANSAFNPFDLNLDGWGEQISEDLDSYEEIFSELHEKYKGGKLAPEISLLLRVGFSAAVLNFSNKALSSVAPSFGDVMKQSPELMKMFTNATANNLSQQSPGFAFANNFMQEQSNRPRGPPPPAPIETKSQPPVSRQSMIFTDSSPNNRPDINAGRGVEPKAAFQASMMPPPMPSQPRQPTSNTEFQTRREMKGPQSPDIDNILSGLKTKTIDLKEQPKEPQFTVTTMEDDSIISISSLKDIQNTTLPKKQSRKRNTSNRNTITLDL